MSNNSQATSPSLDDATREFIRAATGSGLVPVDDLKKVIASLMIESDQFNPKRVADGLVGAGQLTQWQADKLLAGKKGGFFLGSYRLLRPLGKGGMGVVYLGEHHVMKRLMALKILPPESCSDPRRIERFKQEARAAAQLDHPNIVRAYDFAEAGNKLFIAMEYVDGIDLRHSVIRDGTMSVSSALDVMKQTAAGLAHAHERGVIHRDIKPANLLLRTDGVIKISDMGLARLGWKDMGSGEKQRLMGTADFAAPEQVIDSDQVDARSDIYGLGCTIYFLLTSKPPYLGESVTQRLAQHQTKPVPDVREICTECPAAVAEMLLRMMAKRPEDRPNSVLELQAWINRVSPSGGINLATRSQNSAQLSDTSVEEQVYQATIDDSSLSADGQIEIVREAVEDLDLADLDGFGLQNESLPEPSPNLETEILPGGQNAAFQGPVPQEAVGASKKAEGRKQRPPKADSAPKTGEERKDLKRIMIAVAAAALVFIVGGIIYSVVSSDEPDLGTFQRVDDGKGGRITIHHD